MGEKKKGHKAGEETIAQRAQRAAKSFGLRIVIGNPNAKGEVNLRIWENGNPNILLQKTCREGDCYDIVRRTGHGRKHKPDSTRPADAPRRHAKRLAFG